MAGKVAVVCNANVLNFVLDVFGRSAVKSRHEIDPSSLPCGVSPIAGCNCQV